MKFKDVKIGDYFVHAHALFMKVNEDEVNLIRNDGRQDFSKLHPNNECIVITEGLGAIFNYAALR